MKSNILNTASRTVLAGFLLMLVSILTLSFSSEEFGDPKKKITVMSYNIHYGIGMDDKYNLERIAKVITDANPDIVGLQEIGDSTMAATLGELTGMYYVFGPSKEGMDQYGDAILSKYPFEWVGNHSIPSASSSRYQVMGVDIDLSTVYGKGSKIRLLNTHFDWTQSIGSQESRLAAVDVVERGFISDNDLPLILTGDLNAQPNSPPMEKLEEKGWFSKPGGSELFTIPVDKPNRQIDYVLIRPKSAWSIDNLEVIEEPLASDHLPVLMTLKLKDF